MSEPQIDIRPDHWAIVRDILQRHVPQYAVWAFGSRAKWTAKEYSDLDLAIITDSPLPLATSAALAEDFSESDLPWKVDIVDWAETSETFRKIIERDRVVVAEPAWQKTVLGDICHLQGGSIQTGPFGSQLHASDYTSSGTPVVMPLNLIDGRIEEKDIARIPSEFVQKLSRHKLAVGDIIFSRRGDVTRFALVSEKEKGWICGTGCLKVAIGKGNLAIAEFIAKSLASPDSQEWLIRHAVGATMPNLNTGILSSVPVSLPPIAEQRAIAHILGTFDERIELNRRMNETLEAMARSLFNSWFVNFDGVPAEDMQESELGLIPKGWRIGEFEELLVLQRGFDLPTQARIAGQFPVIAAGGINGTHNEAMVKGPGVVTGRSGVLGNVYFELGDFWPLNTTLWVKEFRIAKPCYAYELLRGFDFKLFNSGSAVPTLNRNHIHHLPQIIPPAELINDFEKEAMTLRQRMDSNERESQALAQLRDTLLPKLISGEVRIKDAERLAETA